MDELIPFVTARLRDVEGTAARAVPSPLTILALRDVEAKRALIERYKRAASIPASVSGFVRGQDDGYAQGCLDAIRDLAAVYGDHEDYQEEWMP